MYVILAAGLLIRLTFELAYARPLVSDEKEYDSLGFGLSSNARYEVNGIPTAYRPVGYPMFLATIYLVCGHQPIVVKCFQAVLDTGTSFLIFLLLAGYPDRVRLIGAGLWVLFLPAILYTRFLMSESLFTFLLLLTILLLSRNFSNKPHSQMVIGFLFGALVLIKPGLVLFLVALPFFYRPSGLRPRSIPLIALAFFLVLAPWMLRNYYRFGEISPSSNGGINLLIGNNPHSTGAYGITYDPAILQGATDEFDADRKALKYAERYIVEKPVTFAVNAVKKLGRLFESEGGILVLSFHHDPEDTSSRYPSKYASIPVVLVILTNLPYCALMLAGLFGLLAAPRDKVWQITLVLFASWVLLHIIFFGGGRFHFPLMPYIVVFASVFLSRPVEAFALLSNARKSIGFIVSSMLIALWIIEGIAVYSA